MKTTRSTGNKPVLCYQSYYNGEMTSLIFNIMVTLVLCYVAWGFFYIFLHRRGITYTEYFWWTTGYFITVGGVLSLLFWEFIIRILQNFAITPILVFGAFMLFQILLYIYIPKQVRGPKEYFLSYPDRYYLKIDWRRLISKSADIFAQQICIVLLVLFLHDIGLPFSQIVFWFGVLFMLLHVPLIMSERGQWPSWVFCAIVLVFSVVFPLLILYVPYGFIYNMILHWLFYTIMAVTFWTTHAHSKIRVIR